MERALKGSPRLAREASHLTNHEKPTLAAHVLSEFDNFTDTADSLSIKPCTFPQNRKPVHQRQPRRIPISVSGLSVTITFSFPVPFSHDLYLLILVQPCIVKYRYYRFLYSYQIHSK